MKNLKEFTIESLADIEESVTKKPGVKKPGVKKPESKAKKYAKSKAKSAGKSIGNFAKSLANDSHV